MTFHHTSPIGTIPRKHLLCFTLLGIATKSISVRMPESILMQLKMLANKRDVPYQSLLKIFLAERIEEKMKIH